MLKFYGYKKCSTCRKAEKFLQVSGKEFKYIDITTEPPSLSGLKKIISQSGLDLKKFFNTSGVVYKTQNWKVKFKELSKTELIKALASEGKLIKRPILTDGKNVSVGFNEAEYEAKWA